MYGIGGERELEEQTLDHLTGYEGARPVRIGNGAYNQRQHDVWGALLDSIYLHTKSRDGLPESTWPILVKQVEDAIAHWREPDRGIWEVRGEPQHFTSSKVMCWVACDRGARLARLREDSDARDALAGRGGRDPRRRLRERRRRARRLLPALRDRRARRLVPADPARALPAARRRAHRRDRQRDRRGADRSTGLVLRYRVEETDDGLVGEEGIVRDLLVLAGERARRDRRDVARPGRCARGCSATPRRCSLYAEEIDASSGRHLGNFPQAFTHLALINAVMHVIRADHELSPASSRCSTPAGGSSRT